MTWLYFASLLLSTGCMALLDWRYRLFWFAHPARAALVHFSGLAFFLAWDLVGIHFEVFARGDSPYMTGIEVAPELPLEEIFFLFFLCWVTMVVCAGGARILEKFTRTDA